MSFKGISRRTWLKGTGVLMGLPLLDAMRPFTALGAPHPDAGVGAGIGAGTPRQFPVRFAALYMPNGVNPRHWTPEGHGNQFKLSEILEPLAPFKDDILVLTNLWNAATNTGDGHYVKTGGWLTSTTITRTTGANINSGNTSVDQMIAQRVGHYTPLPSLELGIEPTSTGVDVNVGFTQLYGAHISWSTPTTPLAKEIHPKLAFDRLFRSTAADRPQGLGRDRSVLDLVAEDARRLRQKLGAGDQQKLNEYFESVRAVERRIEFETNRMRDAYLADPVAVAEIEKTHQRVDQWAKRFDPFRDPGQASERGIRHTEHVQLMLDIMALAFWTDSTRATTFMFGNAVSGRNFGFLEGVKGGFHEYSHHESNPEKLEPYKIINRWHQEQFAYFLNRLRSFPEGEGTLLDNCLVLCGSGMRDGNAHSPVNLPLVLAGKGGGSIAPGRHLIYDRKTPMANLHLGLLRRAGVPVDTFADSTEELPGLSDPNYQGQPADAA